MPKSKIKFFFCLLLVLISCGNSTKNIVQTTEVKFGEFVIDVVETGELKATNSVMISAPSLSWRFGDLKITKLIEDGKEVKIGDVLVEFDQAEIQKAIIDAKAELDIAKAELEKLIANQNSRIEDLESDLKMQKISYKISKLELEQATYEADIRKKEIQLQLNQAKISLDKASEEILNQKKIHIQEIKQKEINIKQLGDNLKDAYDSLTKLTIKADHQGLVIIEKSWMNGNQWQVGDQPWSGWPLISLPDLSELKAETQINEVDISKLKLEQDVRLKLDAYPDTTFTGKVTSIATLARKKDKKSKVKVFPVEILINGMHKLLMPGMTISCQIIINKTDKELYIPIESLKKNKDKFYVYFKKGSSFNEKEVTIGEYNTDYVVIEKGLKKGDVIALDDPSLLSGDEKKSNDKK